MKTLGNYENSWNSKKIHKSHEIPSKPVFFKEFHEIQWESMDCKGAPTKPPRTWQKCGARGHAAPKHRDLIRYGARKHQTERVFGAVGFQMAKNHVPGSLQNATLVPPGTPPGAALRVNR